MRDVKAYYSSFQPPDVDKIRAAQFDALIPELSYETALRVLETLRIFRDAGLGEVAAKSLCISLIRYDCMEPAERYTARQIGISHNVLAPEAWRMK